MPWSRFGNCKVDKEFTEMKRRLAVLESTMTVVCEVLQQNVVVKNDEHLTAGMQRATQKR